MHALDNDEEDGEGPSRTSAVPPESDSQQQGLSSLPPLAPGYVRSRAVENDLVKWYSLDRQSQQTLLTGMTVGKRGICHEALVHICVHSFGKKDDRLLQLAFHALTVSAQALILSQAKGFGLGREDQLDQVQDVFALVFSAIQAGKADFAEFAFAAFCKRKAISLYRKKKARFEGAQKRAEFAKDPEDEDGGVDPLDTIETDEPTPEVRALAAVALGKLPEPLRSVFIQYHQFNFNQEKLAEKHGVDVRTIRNWLKKASTMLGAAGEDK